MDDLFLQDQNQTVSQNSKQHVARNPVGGIWVLPGSTCHLNGPGKAVKISSHCARDNDHLWVGWAMFQKLWSLDFFLFATQHTYKGDRYSRPYQWQLRTRLKLIFHAWPTASHSRTYTNWSNTYKATRDLHCPIIQSLIHIVRMRVCCEEEEGSWLHWKWYKWCDKPKPN